MTWTIIVIYYRFLYLSQPIRACPLHHKIVSGCLMHQYTLLFYSPLSLLNSKPPGIFIGHHDLDRSTP